MGDVVVGDVVVGDVVVGEVVVGEVVVEKWWMEAQRPVSTMVPWEGSVFAVTDVPSLSSTVTETRVTWRAPAGPVNGAVNEQV